MQIMQSSFCSKAAVDSVYNFFISAFFFPSFVYWTNRKGICAVHSDECWSIAENTFQTWILLLSQMHIDKAAKLSTFFLSKQNSVFLFPSDLNFHIQG